MEKLEDKVWQTIGMKVSESWLPFLIFW